MLFFVLRLRRPRRPTLFPYTTLFRSGHAQRSAGFGPWLRCILAFNLLDTFLDGANIIEKRIQDRKSTRLNSSHGSTSYAVFCLKKKNTTTSTNYKDSI